MFNKSMAVEVLRIYLGIIFLLKGFSFILDPNQAQTYLEMAEIPFIPMLATHIIALTHLAGGIMLILGLLTSVAALLQIPILLGAAFFVHWPLGIFKGSSDLEYVFLLLALLFFFFVYGSGEFSLDRMIKKR